MDGGRIDSAVERRIVTVLFADLVGFTSLAERLDPEDVASVQDAYFGLVRATIGRYGGLVEKFIGDAAMAVFGLERARDDDAERAVRAGLALANGVEALAGRLGLEVGDLRLRVGINTGEAVTTEAGPDRGRVTGDTVNSAARLQTSAPPGGVLLGEQTALAVADAIDVLAVDPLTVKGKAQPLRASLARAIRVVRSREEALGGLRAPVLGRGPILAALDAIARRAAGGSSERVLVVAPPGVGKTRLIEEFALQRGAATVLQARLRSDPSSPFDAVRQLLRAACGDLSGNAVAGRLADRLVGRGIAAGRAEVVAHAAAALLGGDTETGHPADDRDASASRADQAALFEAWAEALDAAVDGPVIWVVEDLHWAGPDLLAFLDAAQTRRRPEGRLIVATARPNLLERLAGTTDLPADPAAADPTPASSEPWAILELPPLESVDAAALVVALVGRVLPPRLVERVVARSDGNCLFIEELLRAWVAAGVLVAGNEPGTWALAVAVDDAPLPATVQAIYAGQLDDLPGAARTAARRASVAGRRFPEHALSELGVEDVPAALEVLSRRAFVRGPTDGLLTGPEYAYRHALLHDAAYASLARADRALLHRRLAGWLEATAGTRADEVAAEIATQYDAAVANAPTLGVDLEDGRAHTRALAATWLERAGDRAMRLFAHAAALDAYRRSLDLTDGADRLTVARRWTKLGQATLRAGDLDEAATAFARSARGFAELLDEPGFSQADRTEALRGYATAASAEASTRYEQIRFAESLAIAERALDVVGTSDPTATVPLLLARLRGREGLSHDWAGLDREAREVLVTAIATGEADLIYEARRSALGFGHQTGTTDAAAWLAFAEEARGLGRWEDATEATLNAAGQLFDSDTPRVRDLLAEAERMAEARGLRAELAWVGQFRAELGLKEGDWAAVLLDSPRTFDLADAYHYHRVAVRTWFAVTAVAEPVGDRALLTRARDWFEAHRGIFPDSAYGTMQHAGVDLRLATFGLAEPPDLQGPDLLVGFEVPDESPSWLCAVERVVEAMLVAGLREIAAEGVRRYRATALGTLTPHARASRALVGAWLARATGDREQARASFEESLAAARLAEVPWWIARSLRGLAAVGPEPDGADAEAAAIERGLGLSDRALPSG